MLSNNLFSFSVHLTCNKILNFCTKLIFYWIVLYSFNKISKSNNVCHTILKYGFSSDEYQIDYLLIIFLQFISSTMKPKTLLEVLFFKYIE